MARIFSPIKPSTSTFRKLLFLETLLNTTDKASKISNESILGGIASGISKVSGKAEKDIALAFSKVFPDTASGDDLDTVASNHGVPPRYGAIGSAAWVRLIATPGTQYFQNLNTISGQDGIAFQLESDFTMGPNGFDYVPVTSITTGIKTNVKPLSLTQMSAPPSGHIGVINEIAASGGRELEDDRTFRIRIKEGPNILSRNTLAALEQAFLKVNSNVLRVYYNGASDSGKTSLLVSTQNGGALLDSEIDEIITRAGQFCAITDNPRWGDNIFGFTLTNVTYFPVDIDFRVDLLNTADPDQTRQSIQIKMMKLLDHRFFDSVWAHKIDWTNLLDIVKQNQGVRYAPDQYFLPQTDIIIPRYQLPRLRGFIMRNLNGQLIQSFSNLSPIYYPNDPDINFQSTVTRFI